MNALRDYTFGQWLDGVGESLNIYLEDNFGVIFRTIEETVAIEQYGEEKTQSPLFSAIVDGDLHRLVALIDGGESKSVTNIYGNIPLQEAINRYHDDMVNYLVTDYSARDLQPYLEQFARQGLIRSMTTALEKGVDPNKHDEGEKTALMWAANYGYIEIVKLLTKYGANINILDAYKRSALDYCTEYSETHSILLELMNANR